MMSLKQNLLLMTGFSLAAVVVSAVAVQAATVIVDPVNGPLRTLDFGAMRAGDGDTIVIADGEYRECAVWKASNITIKAQNPGKVIVRDQSCMGKGIFVITGNNVTVEGITLRGAKVPDGNGAGIRFEGSGLTVRNMTFIDNQNGILSNAAPQSAISIDTSLFEGNGTCENAGGCGHGIYIGNSAKLTVRASRFLRTQHGHHIKSRAVTTIVENNTIDDGADGTASYEIQLAAGGDGRIVNNTLVKGPKAENTGAAIFIGGEGENPFTAPIVIARNRFTNNTTAKPWFVFNTSANTVRVVRNTITGAAMLVSGKNSQK
jgi:Right handed beta helix region